MRVVEAETMKILVLSQYFLPQPLANAETISAVVRGLAERGVITWTSCSYFRGGSVSKSLPVAE